MILNARKYKKHLSQSILLKERGAPEVLRLILIFLVLVVGCFLYWASIVELKETVSAQGEIIPGEGFITLEILVYNEDLLRIVTSSSLVTFHWNSNN